jgi:hypothetical protein
MHVEVKGTTGDGSSVLLTKNEVSHAREEGGRAVLAVVSGIELIEVKGGWTGERGTETVFQPWRPDAGMLTPLVYEWSAGILSPRS